MRSYLAALLLILLSSCATVGGRKQSLLLKSTPQGARVQNDAGEYLGTTPFVAEVPRRTAIYLEASRGNQVETLKVEGNYRWGRSFAGNLISFWYFGWITDLLTGAAWEYPTEQEFIFNNDSGKVENPKDSKAQLIAIMPPQSIHPDLTDEVGRALEERLKSLELRRYRIMAYNDSLKSFEKRGLDGNKLPDLSTLRAVGEELGVAKIYVGQTDTSDKSDVLVRGEVRDLGPAGKSEYIDVKIPAEKLKSLSDVGWRGRQSDYLNWLPNSTFLDLGSTRTTFNVDKETIYAVAKPTNDFFGSIAPYVSAISLRKMKPPSLRDGWKSRWEMAPTSSLSVAQERIEGLPAVANYDFRRVHVDAGWGGSFNYGSQRHNFYIYGVPVLSYNEISSEARGKAFKATDLGVNLGLEIGYLYFFRRRWVGRIYTRSVAVPTALWEDVLGRASGTPIKLDSSSLISSGFAFGYIFSNKDLPY